MLLSSDCVAPQDKVTMLTELVEQLEDINKHFEPDGLSLLSIAVANEALECVKVLLKVEFHCRKTIRSG